MTEPQLSPKYFVDSKGEPNNDDYLSFSTNKSPNTNNSRQMNRPYFNNYRNNHNNRQNQNSPYKRDNNFNPQGFSSPITNRFKQERSPSYNFHDSGGGGGRQSNYYRGNNRRGNQQHYGLGYQANQQPQQNHRPMFDRKTPVNISTYYHPSMLEDPWKDFDMNLSTSDITESMCDSTQSTMNEGDL